MAKKKRTATATKRTPKKQALPAPLLNLSTFSQRRHVTIDKKRYYLRNPDELSAITLQRLGGWVERVQKIEGLADDEITPQIEAELSEMLDRLCRSVLAAPKGLHDKLGDFHRLQIALAFTRTQ